MPRERTRTIERIVGDRLRQARMTRGFSQAELGKRLDLSFQQVQKYEAGENRIGPSRLLQVARELEVPIGYFFDGLDTMDADDAADLAPPREVSAKVVTTARRIHAIPNSALRNSVLSLVDTLSNNPDLDPAVVRDVAAAEIEREAGTRSQA